LYNFLWPPGFQLGNVMLFLCYLSIGNVSLLSCFQNFCFCLCL
jgi:hypothetical protein